MTLYVFKLGQKEKLILKILALEPKQHQQSIKEKLESLLNKPVNYGSVVNMVKALHRKKLIENEQGKSKSGKTINLWKISKEGLKLLLEHGDLTEEEAKTIIINYYENESMKIMANQIFEKFGNSTAINFFKKALSGEIDLKLLDELLDKPEKAKALFQILIEVIGKDTKMKNIAVDAFKLITVLDILKVIIGEKSALITLEELFKRRINEDESYKEAFQEILKSKLMEELTSQDTH